MQLISQRGGARRLWSAWLAVLLLGVGIGLSGCPDPTVDPPPVTKLYPDIELSAEGLDFNEVRVGTYYFRGITIGNYGRANLDLSDFSITEDARGSFIYELDQSVIAPGGTATLKITYTPPDEGDDAAALTFATNDPDRAAVTVNMVGVGTIPSLVVDPNPPIVFTGVSVGESRFQDLLITNGGTGKLTLNNIGISSEYAADFSVELPPTFSAGKQIGVGELVGIRVTYHPDAETPEIMDLGYLIIESDDPRRSRFEVEMRGSTELTPIDTPPSVVIVEPDPYETELTTRYVGQPLIFRAVVGDEEDAAQNLSVTWYSNIDGKLGDSDPDADGNVSLVTSALSVGEHVIRAFAYDSIGQSGRAEVNVQIWNEDSEFDYIIAGYEPGANETAFRYFTVDDNIEIWRTDGVTGNTVPCLIVIDDILNNLSPAICNAHIGDTIRVIVYDRYADKGRVDGLNLFFGEDKQRVIEPTTVDTGRTGTACKESPYKNEWYAENSEPYTGDCVILDQSIVVAIPLTPDGN